MSTQYRGSLKSFRSDRPGGGFGFLRRDDSNIEDFLHASALRDAGINPDLAGRRLHPICVRAYRRPEDQEAQGGERQNFGLRGAPCSDYLNKDQRSTMPQRVAEFERSFRRGPRGESPKRHLRYNFAIHAKAYRRLEETLGCHLMA